MNNMHRIHISNDAFVSPAILDYMGLDELLSSTSGLMIGLKKLTPKTYVPAKIVCYLRASNFCRPCFIDPLLPFRQYWEGHFSS
jgi:hypothetical protein